MCKDLKDEQTTILLTETSFYTLIYVGNIFICF